MLILRLLKKIFCKHDWEKMWIDRVWYIEEPNKKLMESWYCKCKKCGRKRFVEFDGSNGLGG